jgi:hypothetical protein
VLSEEVDHFISKVLTQRKRAYQRYSTTANWADRIDDKTLFGKLWQQSQVTLRLVLSYFNWIWQHS